MQTGIPETGDVVQILEDGRNVETALEQDIETSPRKRNALYGGYFQKGPHLPDSNIAKPVLGGAASSAAYTAAGLPGSELVNEYLRWGYSMGETTGDYFLFMGWAFGVIGATYGLQKVGKYL